MTKTNPVTQELFRIQIEKIDSQGDGIARDSAGKIVFVEGALPGEIILARKILEKKDRPSARIVRVETRNPRRVQPFCPYYIRCGACQLQHASYDLQLEMKKSVIEDAFSRIAKIVPSNAISPVRPCSLQAGYRNKVALPVSRSASPGGIEIGYYRKRSHRLVDIDRCPVAMPSLNTFLAEMKAALPSVGLVPFDERSGEGILRHVVLRGGQETGEVLVILVVHRYPDPSVTERVVRLARRLRKRHPCLAGLVLNLNPSGGNSIFGTSSKGLSGRTFFIEKYDNFEFKFEATSFSQVNSAQAAELYRTAAREACPKGSERVLELYSGVGTLTCFLSARASRVVALEEWEPSVECLRENLIRNKLSNVDVLSGAAEKTDWDIKGPVDTIVVDPPRSGLHPSVTDSIKELAPDRIVYVSCNPSTLARDIGALCNGGGYSLCKVLPFDLFPQTSHVESVAILDRPFSS